MSVYQSEGSYDTFLCNLHESLNYLLCKMSNDQLITFLTFIAGKLVGCCMPM